MFDNELVPYLRRKFDLSEIITYRVLKVAGLGESGVDDLVGHLIASSSNPTVGVLAHPGQVDVRIAAKAGSTDEAMRLISPVEAEVRKLLGRQVFAVDEETMEDALGVLMREKGKTIAVYEDLTGGLVAERFLQACPSCFVEGVIGSSLEAVKRVLSFSRQSDRADELLKEPLNLTNELASAVRAQAQSHFGLALHAVPDPDDKAENLARGRTYVSLTDGRTFKNRTYNMAGRGRPDRTRMSLNALDLVRLVLLEGMVHG